MAARFTRRERITRAISDTKQDVARQVILAIGAGVILYVALVAGAATQAEKASASLDAMGPAVAAAIFALVVYVVELGINYARAGDRLALDAERKSSRAAWQIVRERAEGAPGQLVVEPTPDRTLYELMDVFRQRGKTALQAEAQASSYMRLAFEFSGQVHDLQKTSGGFLLSFLRDFPRTRWVFCHFHSESAGRIEMLRKGDRVKVRGRLDEVGKTTASLSECEFERL